MDTKLKDSQDLGDPSNSNYFYNWKIVKNHKANNFSISERNK